MRDICRTHQVHPGHNKIYIYKKHTHTHTNCAMCLTQVVQDGKKTHTHPEDGDKTQHTDGVKKDETTHE